MSIQMALLLFGGFLLLIAILGGGFEIRELKIPKVERAPRVLAGIVGMLFMVYGLDFEDTSPNYSRTEDYSQKQPESQVSSQIQFTIFDELEPDMISSGQSEQSLIRIDGNPIGTLTVSEHFPKSELAINVANEGQHSFAIEATAVLYTDNKLAEVNCFGTGMIDVTQKSRFLFEARYDPQGGPCSVWLEKR